MTIAMDSRKRPKQNTNCDPRAGDELREEGMARSAARHAKEIQLGMIAMLSTMLERDDLTGTTDDISSDLDQKREDGGNWVGSIPKSLVRLGLITPIGFRRSARRSRRCGWLRQYRIIDSGCAREFIDSSRAHIDAPSNSEPSNSEMEHTVSKETNRAH